MIFYTLHHLFHALFDGRWADVQINCLTVLIGSILYFLTYGYLTEYATGFNKLFKDWWWYIGLVDIAVMAVVYRSYYGRSLLAEVTENIDDDSWDYDQRTHQYSKKEKFKPTQDHNTQDHNTQHSNIQHPNIQDPNIQHPNIQDHTHVFKPEFGYDEDVQAEIDASLEHFSHQPQSQHQSQNYPQQTEQQHTEQQTEQHRTEQQTEQHRTEQHRTEQQTEQHRTEQQRTKQHRTQEQTRPTVEQTEDAFYRQQNDIDKFAPLLQAEFAKLDHDPSASEAMRIIEDNIDKVIDAESEE